jgi:hypothetical protein
MISNRIHTESLSYFCVLVLFTHKNTTNDQIRKEA